MTHQGTIEVEFSVFRSIDKVDPKSKFRACHERVVRFQRINLIMTVIYSDKPQQACLHDNMEQSMNWFKGKFTGNQRSSHQT